MTQLVSYSTPELEIIIVDEDDVIATSVDPSLRNNVVNLNDFDPFGSTTGGGVSQE